MKTIWLFVFALLASSMSLAQVTIPAGCVTAPLSTTPTGPTWVTQYNAFTSSSPENVKVTFWRKPCSPSGAVTLATFEPLSGSPFVCTNNEPFIQNNAQFFVRFLQNPANLASGFCGDLLVPATFALTDVTANGLFNPSNGFTFISDASPASNVATVRLDVGGYDPSAYGSTSPIPITGKHSGNWFSPSRNGEGFILEVGASGSDRTIIATWFTYKDGQQMWIIGSASLPVGTSSIQVPMFVTRGGQFGAAFNPSTVVAEAWGTLTFSFQGCNAATVNYAPTVGAGGTIQLTRLKTQIDGLPCN